MLTDQDKSWLKSNCGKVERTGLYILVIMIWLNSCSHERKFNIMTDNGKVVSVTSE